MIFLNFVEGLPTSHGKNIILVVIDRLFEYSHLIHTAHPYSYVDIVRLFFNNIFKLCGLPKTNVSDRDVTFISTFWKALFHLSGTKLCISSTYRPQMDGRFEVVNQTIEMYLRCFTGAHPTKWLDWLS